MKNRDDCANYDNLLKLLQIKSGNISVSHLLDYTHLTKKYNNVMNSGNCNLCRHSVIY